MADKASGAQGAEEGEQTLMGREQGSMNLHTMRQRAMVLKETLQGILNVLHFAPTVENWQHVLEQFSTVNVQYHQLLSELRPVTSFHAVVPHKLSAEFAQYVPMQLSSRMLPEQEQLEKQLYQHWHVQHASEDIGKQFTSLTELGEDYNAALDSLLDSIMAEKSEARTQIAANSAAMKERVEKLRAGFVLAPVPSRKAGAARDPGQDLVDFAFK